MLLGLHAAPSSSPPRPALTHHNATGAPHQPDRHAWPRGLYHGGGARHAVGISDSQPQRHLASPRPLRATHRSRIGCSVLDGAVTVFDAVAGVEAQTRTVWRQATKVRCAGRRRQVARRLLVSTRALTLRSRPTLLVQRAFDWLYQQNGSRRRQHRTDGKRLGGVSAAALPAPPR